MTSRKPAIQARKKPDKELISKPDDKKHASTVSQFKSIYEKRSAKAETCFPRLIGSWQLLFPFIDIAIEAAELVGIAISAVMEAAMSLSDFNN